VPFAEEVKSEPVEQKTKQKNEPKQTDSPAFDENGQRLI
jgi:hypothetical protein